MPIYTGVNGVVRTVQSPRAGVNGAVREIKSGFCCAGGVVRQFFGPLEGLQYFCRASQVPGISGRIYNGSSWDTEKNLSQEEVSSYGSYAIHASGLVVTPHQNRQLHIKMYLYAVFSNGRAVSLDTLVRSLGDCTLSLPVSIQLTRTSGTGGGYFYVLNNSIPITKYNTVLAGTGTNGAYTGPTMNMAVQNQGGAGISLTVNLSPITINGVSYPLRMDLYR